MAHNINNFSNNRQSFLTHFALLFFIYLSPSCSALSLPIKKHPLDHLSQVELTIKSNDKLIFKTFVAYTFKQRTKGLSDIKEKDFNSKNAMLFLFSHPSIQQFWMPYTHFDLDIFFLDQEFKVVDIHRNLKAHLTKKEPVPRSKQVFCYYVLEIKSGKNSQAIQIGDQFTPVKETVTELIKKFNIQ